MQHSIMVVDHNEKNISSLTKLLRSYEYNVITSSTQNELTENLKQDAIDLILVNTSTEFVEIEWFCSFVRESDNHRHIPVIFISNGLGDAKEVVECFASGGNDYLQKPINTEELISRIVFHIKQYAVIAKMHARNEKLAGLATYDQLTKVSSRLHVQTLLRQQISLLTRHGGKVGFIYLRILELTKVNALLGYGKGDKVLYTFAGTLKKMIRESDVVGRWIGGDFVVILPNTDEKSALTLAKKINKLLITDEVLNGFSLKYSFGVVQLREGEAVSDLIDRSRKTMEEATEDEHENILAS